MPDALRDHGDGEGGEGVIDYVFARERDAECECPDVVCRWHKGIDLRLYWNRDPADSKLKPDIIEERAGARLRLRVAQ